MEVKKKAFQKLNLLDQTVHVKIMNAKVDGIVKNFQYDVKIFDPNEIN
jgi:hypothetical protein